MATTRRSPTTSSAPTTAPSAAWLTPAQMRTLDAVCETLFPATVPPEGEDDPHGFYARPASALRVALLLAETLAQEPPATRAEFAQLLNLLDAPLFVFALTRRAQRFAEAAAETREAALRAMSVSRIATLRQGFQALKRLAGFIYYSAPVVEGRNPNWPALDYTRPPLPPSPEAAPKRLRPLDVTGDLALTADVVVVGSGAGGGVVAAELAAAGRDVLVLEKGGYYNEADFTGSEAEMTPRLYLRRGLLATRDLGIVVLAGSSLGGGTIVNWSTSLRTPANVLEQWEREHGLTGVTGAEYQRGFDVVERRIGVNREDSEPNANNAALERGCAALGYAHERIRRNASDCRQRCGACGYGCQFGRKQSTLLTFLQDAGERGARFVVGCQVERVVIEAGRAVGVEGWALDTRAGHEGERRRVTVHAPAVVVAGGAVESPALLLRSGLANPNIGRHLRLHPVANIAAYYAEPVHTWEGSLQTAYSDHFAQLQDGYGVRFEVAPAHPGLFALSTPWTGGREHKRLMRRAPFAAAFISLTRDTGEGRVTLDAQGDPVLAYWPNATDRQRLVLGMQELAKIAVAGGAVGVATLHSPPLLLESASGRPGDISDRQLAQLTDEIARRGVMPNTPTLFSAHQMGTCRLGASAKTAVADPYGEVFGARGLYIADASGFPTASGVNPMISVMGLAFRVARYLASRA